MKIKTAKNSTVSDNCKDWRKNLKPGDEITISTGDVITISEIVYLPNDNSFIVRNTDGDVYLCFPKEIK